MPMSHVQVSLPTIKSDGWRATGRRGMFRRNACCSKYRSEKRTSIGETDFSIVSFFLSLNSSGTQSSDLKIFHFLSQQVFLCFKCWMLFSSTTCTSVFKVGENLEDRDKNESKLRFMYVMILHHLPLKTKHCF